MKSPTDYAAKAIILEAGHLYSSAAVLYRMAANAAPRNKRALAYRAAAKRCEARRSAAA